MKISLKKCSFHILALLLSLLILELSLRTLGGALTLIQEYRNLSSESSDADLTILCLGESTTALGGKSSYPSLLQDICNEGFSDIKINVINKGVPGVTSTYIAYELKQYIDEYKPNIIITMIGVNDRNRSHAIENIDLPPQPTKAPFYTNSRVYKFTHTLFELLQVIFLKGKSDLGLNRVKDANLTPKIADLSNMTARDILNYANAVYDITDRSMSEKILSAGAVRFPHDLDILGQLGHIYQCDGEYDQAESISLKVLDYDPDNKIALTTLANLYHEVNNVDDELWARKRLEEVSPHISWPTSIDLAAAYLKDNNHSMADVTIRKALNARRGDHPNVWGALGIVYLDQGLVDTANIYFERANILRSEQLLSITLHNYRYIEKIARAKGIQIIAIQYPVRDATVLKSYFQYPEDIIFVSNEKLFREAIQRDGYYTYFTDMFGGDFGHCNEAGNMVLANNIFKVLQPIIHESQLT